jgi:hypothetical protein
VAGAQGQSRPVIEMFVARRARQALTDLLSVSRQSGVQELLASRALTNTVHFPPVASASGQPLETAILLTALLFQADHFSVSFQNELESKAREANAGGSPEDLEGVYLDLMSLGKRLDWGQLTHLVRRMDGLEPLRMVAALARELDQDVAVLFASIHWATAPERVPDYLLRFGRPAVEDLAFALGHGQGSLLELLRQQKQIHHRGGIQSWLSREPFAGYLRPLVHVAERSPRVGLALKYDLLLVGGMLLVLGIATVRQPPYPGEPDPILTAPRAVAALLLFFVVLLLTEPYLIQKSQRLESPLSWEFPMAPDTIRATIATQLQPMMNQFTLLALLSFLVIQAIIYTICLAKLREIRRQDVSVRTKLRLLENEENMFDSGLYFGIGGTVIALVLLAMGIVQPSLMAAYASTLFGIVFVALLKICHLRPFRRRLILESESLTA